MATRDDGYDGLRAETLRVVREGYELLRPKLDDAGITREDEEAVGAPADAFAGCAQVLRDVSKAAPPAHAAAMLSDASALELLAGFARGASLTWAEVRS